MLKVLICSHKVQTVVKLNSIVCPGADMITNEFLNTKTDWKYGKLSIDAKKAAEIYILQRDCGIKIIDLDKNQNLIVDVLHQKGNLVHFLLSQGCAKICKPIYNMDENQLLKLEELQQNAQENGRGIWKNDTTGNKI